MFRARQGDASTITHHDHSIVRDLDPYQVPTLLLNHASQFLTQASTNALRPLGLGLVFLPVAFALEREGALTQARLCEIAQIGRPIMAVRLRRMERVGLLLKRRHNVRGFEYLLTEDAKAKLSMARNILFATAHQALDGVSHAHRAALVDALEAIVANLDQ